MFNGMSEYIPLLGDFIEDVVRNIPSVFLLTPHIAGSSGDTLFASTPRRNYTISQIPELLADAGLDEAAAKVRYGLKYAAQIDKPFPFPTVCAIGTGVDTTGRLQWTENIVRGTNDGKWTHPSTEVKVDGDGTVPRSSATIACDVWSKAGGNVRMLELKGATHIGMMKDKKMFQLIDELACSN